MKTSLNIDQYAALFLVIDDVAKTTEEEGMDDGKSNECATEGSCC